MQSPFSLTYPVSCLLLLLLPLVYGCGESERKESEALAPEATHPIRTGEVIIINPDSTAVPFVNFSHPTLAYDRQMLFLPPDSATTIAVDGEVRLIVASWNAYETRPAFLDGDTIRITRRRKSVNERELDYPYYEVINRPVSAYDLNADYYLYPHDISPSVYLKRLPREIKDTVGQLTEFAAYYRTGIGNLEALREAGQLNGEAYERHRSRLDGLAEIALWQIGSAETIRPDYLQLDTFRIPRLRTVRYWDHHLVDLMVQRLPVRRVAGKWSMVKLDSIIRIVAGNRGDWPVALKEYILTELLRMMYYQDPLFLEERLDNYRTYFSDGETALRPFRRQVDRKKLEMEVDVLRLAELDTSALLGRTGEVVTVAAALADCPTEYVLIDVWATWCRACLLDAPLVERLADSLNLSVLKISTDVNEVDWRVHLGKQPSSPRVRNYIMARPRASQFFAENDISALPRYLLADRAGNILISEIRGLRADLGFVAGSIAGTIGARITATSE